MQATWVFDDFGKGIHQRDLIMLLASGKLWSIHCPGDTRVLYCSDSVGNAVFSLGENKIFDKVILLPKRLNNSVDTSVFWSYPKLEILARLQIPTYLIDHDFLVLEDIRKSLPENEVCYTFSEDAKGYYPSSFDSHIRQLSYKTRWPEESANVSFLQLPFPEWTQLYAGTSIKIMEELSESKAPNSKYLIFAEQLVFKHMTSLLSKYSCLIRNKYQCRTESWTNEIDKNGIWSVEEAWGKKFIHYGPVKKQWGKVKYDEELKVLCNLAGISYEILRKTDYLRK